MYCMRSWVYSQCSGTMWSYSELWRYPVLYQVATQYPEYLMNHRVNHHVQSLYTLNPWDLVIKYIFHRFGDLEIWKFSNSLFLWSWLCFHCLFAFSYKPDNCNICGCGNGLTMAFCTRAFCGPSNPTNECTRCMDGYSLNAQNVCEQTLLVNQVKPAVPQSPQSPSAMCVCPMMYNPVCCAETTYSNSCEARCQGHADTTQCTTGRCSDPIEALPLFQIPHW